MTDIYIVITEDRHADVEATPFLTLDTAIAHAEREAITNGGWPPEPRGREGRGSPLDLLEPSARRVTGAMAASGWVWYCRYGPEGDNVRVVRRKLGA